MVGDYPALLICQGLSAGPLFIDLQSVTIARLHHIKHLQPKMLQNPFPPSNNHSVHSWAYILIYSVYTHWCKEAAVSGVMK